MQQASHHSGCPNTYYPYLQEMIDYVKKVSEHQAVVEYDLGI